MSFLQQLFRLTIVGVTTMLFCGAAIADSEDRNEDIRAAMVFNFTRYVEWTHVHSTDTLTLCVSSSADIADEFSAFSGRRIGARTLQVQDLDAETAEHCHLAYMSSDDISEEMMTRLHGAGVLTVSSSPRFSKDGMIGLILIGRQTRFEVNNTLARQSGVTFSSRLLRLAVEVH